MTSEQKPAMTSEQIVAALMAFDERVKAVQDVLDDNYSSEDELDLPKAIASLHMMISTAYRNFAENGDPTALELVDWETGEVVSDPKVGMPQGFAPELADTIFGVFGVLRRLGFELGPMLMGMLQFYEGYVERTFVKSPLEEELASVAEAAEGPEGAAVDAPGEPIASAE